MSKAKKYYQLISIEPEGYISQIGAHRFGLTFQSKVPSYGKSAAIIQMNGSKAGPTGKEEAWKVDSTIGKVLCWCYENDQTKFDLIHCLNLFSYVEPNPYKLEGKKNIELNLIENDITIKRICGEVDTIIVAYGDCKGIAPEIVKNRVEEVLMWFEKVDLFNVGELTQKKNPRHGRSWNKKPGLQLFRRKLS